MTPWLLVSSRGCGSLAVVLALAACAAPPAATPAGESVASTMAQDAQVLRGRAIVISNACGDCHGGFGGNPAAPGWLLGRLTELQDFPVGPFMTRPRNLTPDDATGTGRYTERQIFNALRFGLRPSTTPDVEITSTVPGQGNHPANPDYLAPSMPWQAWRHMPDADLRAIAAYLKRGLVPRTNLVEPSDAPPDKWAGAFSEEEIGTYPTYAYPTANEVPGQESNARVQLGRAMVLRKDCGGCHGGESNPAKPGFLDGLRDTTRQQFQMGPFKTRARNLTPDNTTGTGRFSERQIFNALRFGLRPGETPDVEITSTTPGVGNHPVNPKYLAPPMPWPSWRHMSDEELWAIAAYLKQGLKPVSNRVPDSEGPPDFWASAYTVAEIGPYPAHPFPTANERAR